MKNKWGSVIRKLGLFLLCFLMAACSIDMDTQLDLKDDQSGQRIITISVGKDAIEDYGSDELEKIEQVIADYKPNSLEYKKDTDDDGNVQYVFTLAFSSLDDYRSKVEELIGREPVIELSEPDTVFSKGVSFKEDFSSNDLTLWFREGLEKEGIENDITGNFVEETTMIYKGEEYDSGSYINVNDVEVNPLDFIAIQTKIKEDGSFDRTVEFILPQDTYDENKEEIDSLFASMVPEGAEASWVDSLNYPDQYMELSDEQVDYCIQFSASDLDDLMKKNNQVFQTESSHIVFEESDEEGDSPYQLLKNWNEVLDLSSFGSDSQGEVQCHYSLETEDGSSVYNNYDQGESTWSGSYHVSLLDVGVRFRQVYPVASLTAETTINDESNITQTFVISYEGTLAEEGATRAADYLKTTFQDVAQIENEKDGDAQNVLITFSGNMAEIMENINAFAGGSYNTVRYTAESANFYSQDISFNYSLNLSQLKELLGYDGEITVRFVPRSGDSIEGLAFNGTHVYDYDELNFTSDDGYVTFSYTATRMLWMNLIGGIIGFVIILLLLLVGSLFYVKKWAAKHGIQDQKFAEQAKAFYMAMFVAVKRFCKRVWDNVKHLNQLLVPEDADREIFEYFYGKMYLTVVAIGIVVVACVLNFLQVLITESLNFTLIIIGILVSLGLMVYYTYDFFRKDPQTEKKIDQLIDDYSNQGIDVFLDELDIESQDLIVAPVRLIGPSNEMLAYLEDIVKDPKNALKKYRTRTGPRLAVGSDKKRRYTHMEMMYLFMTEQELLIQRVEYYVVRNKQGDRHSTEYHYKDINGIFTGTKVSTQNDRNATVTRNISYLKIVGFSGTKDAIYVEDGEALLSEEIRGLQNLVRDKKTVEEENEDE